jgi:hypothetical protein
LKPDTAGELRAAESLANGQKVYLSAYEAGTGTHKGTALYTQTGGTLVADGGSGLAVETGSTYNFTAYSYYDNTTDTPSATDVDPAKDLVWGQQAGKAITANDRTVSIVMTRRFAKAKVRISCSTVAGATIQSPLGNVTITSSYADLSIPDGTLSKGADITHTVTFPDNFPTTDITSNGTHMIYPGVQVNIASMTVEVVNDLDSPFYLSDLSMKFDNLTGGKNYVLEMIVKDPRFAYSNIYWVSTGTDTGYLTFDTQDNGHQGYQGVFFRWGSLVGISPARTNGSGLYSTATPVYIPTYVAGGTSTWNVRSGATNPYSTWTVVRADVAAPATDIPYLDGSYNVEPYGIDNTYVMDTERNTTAMYDSLRGDICQYLGKTDSTLNGYRLPKGDEFVGGNQAWNTTTPTADGWIKGDGSFVSTLTAGYADGRADLLATQLGTGYDPAQPTNGAGVKLGAAINQELGVVFPAAGVRTGTLTNVGVYGYNWSCSAISTTNAWGLLFNGTTVGSQSNGITRGTAMPVRCIRKVPGEP